MLEDACAKLRMLSQKSSQEEEEDMARRFWGLVVGTLAVGVSGEALSEAFSYAVFKATGPIFMALVEIFLWIAISATGPLCLLGLLWMAVRRRRPRKRFALFIWAVAESGSWLHVRHAIATTLDKRSPPLSGAQLDRARESAMKVQRYEFVGNRTSEMINGWTTNWSREHLLNWEAWKVANAPSFKDVPSFLRDDIERNVDHLRAKLHGKPSDEETRYIRLTLDSVKDRAMAKPLWLYVLLRGGQWLIAEVHMRCLGFRPKTYGRLRFWIWENPKKTFDEPALVFIHGLGLGLLPYIGWMDDFLEASKSRPAIIVPDLYYLSMAPPIEIAVRGGIPDSTAHVAAIEAAILEHSPTADFFVHSYGSVVASWLLHDRPHLIRALAMAEPVAVLIHHARVCRSFLYDLSHEHKKVSLYKALVHRLVATDPGVVHVLMRHFWWFESTIFLEDLHNLPQPILLILSEFDEYTPSFKILNRLLEMAVQLGPEAKKPIVKWIPGASHGDHALSSSIRDFYFSEFSKLKKHRFKTPPRDPDPGGNATTCSSSTILESPPSTH